MKNRCDLGNLSTSHEKLVLFNSLDKVCVVWAKYLTTKLSTGLTNMISHFRAIYLYFRKETVNQINHLLNEVRQSLATISSQYCHIL